MGTVVSLDYDGNRVAISDMVDDADGSEEGLVRIFESTWDGSNGTWTRLGSYINGETSGDEFGDAMDLDSAGTRIIIGAHQNDSWGQKTSKYANDAQRRKNRMDQKQVHEVDYGNNEMALHSEASFSPNWPEIVWFFCNIPPPKNSGPTTFCDGIKLWDSLTIETKNFFLTNPLEYILEVPIGYKKKGAKKKKWLLNYNGAGDGILDLNKGILKMKQIRFATTESRLIHKLCFSNHVLYRNTDPTIKKWGIFGQKKIPKKVMKNVKENSDKLIFDHNWKKFDLIMLDNKRFMHGRRKFNFKEKRDILNIQTSVANFAYGESVRSNLK